MKCAEKTALSQFVDGELGRERALEIDRHVAECAACRREVEEIRALDARIQGTLRTEGSGPRASDALRARLKTALDREVEAEIAAARPRARILRLAKRIAAVAAAVLLPLTIGFVVAGLTAGPAAASFAKDHVACTAMALTELEHGTCNKGLLEGFCHERGGARARLVSLEEAGYKVVSGSICTIDGIPYAHVIYGCAGKAPLSVYVGRRYYGAGGALLGAEAVEPVAGGREVCRLRGSSGVEYVAVLPASRADLRAVLEAEVARS